MNILLTVATKEEVESVMESMDNQDNGYAINEHSVHVLITGVGMVATTYHLTTMFSSDITYDLMLNIGLAGGFNRDQDLGTVVHVTSDQFAELGAEDDKDFKKISLLKPVKIGKIKSSEVDKIIEPERIEERLKLIENKSQ